jgi:hypothetical protein
MTEPPPVAPPLEPELRAPVSTAFTMEVLP